MRYIDPRFVILIFGYVLLSDLLNLWTESLALARAASALATMLFIYRFPSKIKADFINWIGGSVLAAIAIFLVSSAFAIAASIPVLSIFFPAYFKK